MVVSQRLSTLRIKSELRSIDTKSIIFSLSLKDSPSALVCRRICPGMDFHGLLCSRHDKSSAAKLLEYWHEETATPLDSIWSKAQAPFEQMLQKISFRCQLYDISKAAWPAEMLILVNASSLLPSLQVALSRHTRWLHDKVVSKPQSQ